MSALPDAAVGPHEIMGIASILELSALYTYRDTPAFDAEQVYLGAEYRFTALGIEFSIGAYGHASGDNPDKASLASAGLGYRF
jgi:hypothetical protein